MTVTDALPSGVNFISLDITNGTCSFPQPGTPGTVSCTMRFGPATASSVMTIHVEATQTGTFVNTVQTSTGQQASASTTVTDPPPPPPGSFQVTKTGPATVIMHEGQRSEKFPYTITIKYVGPPRTSSINTRFVDQMPIALTGVSYANTDNMSLSNCGSENGPTQPDGAPGALTLHCDISIDPTKTASFQVVSGPYPTRPGVQTNVFELANGDSASFTTDFVLIAQPPPPPPEPPPPLRHLPATSAATPAAGAACRTAATVVEKFTRPVRPSPKQWPSRRAAETVQVALTWPEASSSFDVTGITLVSGGRVLAQSGKLEAGNLKITKKRTKRSLDVRIRNVKRGKLKFKIVAKKLGKSTQSWRRSDSRSARTGGSAERRPRAARAPTVSPFSDLDALNRVRGDHVSGEQLRVAARVVDERFPVRAREACARPA